MISAWFISDLHLHSMDQRESLILLRFLQSFLDGTRKATHLFLLGDIFDFWVGDHPYFANQYQPLLEALRRMVNQGIHIEYFEGNHDVHVKRFWEKEMGIPCWVDFQIVKLGSLTLRLEHGDLINPDDKKYLRYRSIIRHPFMEKLAHRLPAATLHSIGRAASRKSRAHSSVLRKRNESELRQMIRSHTRRAFDITPFDALIAGHMHIFDQHKFDIDQHSIQGFNLGSWFENPPALHLFELEFSWVALGDSSETVNPTRKQDSM